MQHSEGRHSLDYVVLKNALGADDEGTGCRNLEPKQVCLWW